MDVLVVNNIPEADKLEEKTSEIKRQEQAKSDEVISFVRLVDGSATTVVTSLVKNYGLIISSQAEQITKFFG